MGPNVAEKGWGKYTSNRQLVGFAWYTHVRGKMGAEEGIKIISRHKLNIKLEYSEGYFLAVHTKGIFCWVLILRNMRGFWVHNEGRTVVSLK